MTLQAGPGLRLEQDDPTEPLDRQSRGTLAETLRRHLADDILDGRLLPGVRLDEQELAARFGVSRTPVREAFKLLAATGLVQVRPNKGVVVTSITPERLAQMFEVMGEIEAACARFAAQRMTAEERQRLAALHAEAGALARAGDREAYDAMNTRFHSAIYAGAHNDYMQETAQAIRQRLRPFRRAQFRVSGRLSLSWLEHDSVVRAILHGDGEAAYHALRLHVTTVGDASADYVGRSSG
ncbi:DNA-binding GntR family transcriptional regulator [Azospirillum lipoferum]|uniref:GntR family transcriptional regulator n=1 Tax=Azospirillum lipoferum TaxID=193 RepID=A0A5A9GPZ9_AZOLI|nr:MULTISPECIES: GntR family transcriptional regulator [Azospirillum]KAA0595369.1 GntR family transcriptional regulator [Azospirillum lipoferum]MCP1611738.1 DNA-binding GntR family transcriptional regulator [Azospirillum lipoferum]MDW5533504.1 GntR family transcriptional regulator [Azospirillum sp. NL1]